MDLPASAAEASAAFVTAALRDGGALRDAEVADLRGETIGAGVGILGDLARLHLTYRGDAGDAPPTLILKLPSPYEGNRAYANQMRFYEREVRFYRDVAPEVGIRVPRCWWSDFDAATGTFGLLLEDLGHLQTEDQVMGITPARAEVAARAIARFHAAWWESPRLEQLEWMPFSNSPLTMQAAVSYRQLWPAFADGFGASMSPEWLDIGVRVGERFEAVLDALAVPPHTIAHTDFRVDNLFFGVPGSHEELAVVDWQLATRGSGPYDIGYLLCGSATVENRRAAEVRVLRAWHDELTAAGRDYAFDRAWTMYRLTALVCLVYPVTIGGQMDVANEHGAALVRSMIERAWTAVTDLDALDVLP